MVEHDRATFRALQASRAALAANAVELRRADALEFLRTAADRYDVVFVDPPFTAGYLPRLWALLPQHMEPDALVYCENAARPAAPEGWETWREGRAGRVVYQLLKRVRA
jgi:16S rRNA (guanine966-N2)-methyltransferase